MQRPAILLIALLALLVAQSAGALKEERRAQVREQIRSVKVWELTRDLELSEDQAKVFFPEQQSHENSKEALRRERDTIEAEMEARLGEGRRGDRQLLVYLERIKQVDKQISAQDDEFQRKLTRILSPEQQVRYELFEKRFDARLKQMIDQIKREEQRGSKSRSQGSRDSVRSRSSGDRSEMQRPSYRERAPQRQASKPATRPTKRPQKAPTKQTEKKPDTKSDEKRPSRDGQSKSDSSPSKSDSPRGKRG